jgi:hypothetical protein
MATMTGLVRIPVDVDAIEARAAAAPGGSWDAFPDTVWIPWHADGDDEFGPGEYWRSGRVLGLLEHGWHAGSEDPGPELWTFLASARDDVLALAAEVRRLRAAAAAGDVIGKAA